MADPSISEIKYLGGGTLDILEVRIPDDYPDPENLRLVIYDRSHNGSTTDAPAASDIYDVTADGLLYTEDTDLDGNDDDGILHYTFGTSENGDTIRLHAQDAVGLYNAVTGETYGLFNWSGSPYTVSTATGDPFAGQTATLLDNTGQISGVTSLSEQPDGSYTLNTSPDPGTSFICFTPGTAILTPQGPRPIETLRIGDALITKDFGAQRIRWIGQRRIVDLATCGPAAQPITLKAHCFGPDVPARDTQVSPNHAILADSWKSALYFGEEEVLLTAKSLLASDRVHRNRQACVTYVHILLDRHSLIWANGMWAESLYLGSQCMEMLSPANRSEIFDLFPHLGGSPESYGQKVRPEIRPHDSRVLI